MRAAARPQERPAFVETPQGLFSASGYWFHTSLQALHDYAPEVLERVSVERLLQQAERWLRSPQTVAIWLLPVLLWQMGPLLAVLVTLLVFMAWTLVRPLFVSWRAARFFGLLEHIGVQGLFVILTLSGLGMTGRSVAVVTGLLGFVALRWGLVQRILGYVLDPLLGRLYPLPVPDHVLKSVLVRKAVKLRVRLPDVDAMQHVFFDTVLNKTKRRKK